MAARADDRDGSCKEIRTGKLAGKWRVQYTYEDEFGRKSRLSRVFPTKTEGKEFLRGLRRGAAAEVSRRQKGLTLAEWFDWLAANDFPESLAASTIAARVSRFNRYVRDEWGGVELMRLDALAIKAFYRGLLESGVGRATVVELKRDLVRTFNLAIKPYHGVPWTCGNPFALHVAAPPRRDAVALAPEEARRALRCKELTPKERALLGVFLLAGLRLSEAMALTRGQIRFDEGIIRVDRSVKFSPRREQSVGLPKGDKVRCAVMCRTLSKLLEAATEGMEPDSYVWPKDNADEPRLKRNVYRTWDAILEKARLPEDMSRTIAASPTSTGSRSCCRTFRGPRSRSTSATPRRA